MKIILIFILAIVLVSNRFDGFGLVQVAGQTVDSSSQSISFMDVLDSFKPAKKMVYLGKNAMLGVPFAVILEIINILCKIIRQLSDFKRIQFFIRF